MTFANHKNKNSHQGTSSNAVVRTVPFMQISMCCDFSGPVSFMLSLRYLKDTSVKLLGNRPVKTALFCLNSNI